MRFVVDRHSERTYRSSSPDSATEAKPADISGNVLHMDAGQPLLLAYSRLLCELTPKERYTPACGAEACSKQVALTDHHPSDDQTVKLLTTVVWDMHPLSKRIHELQSRLRKIYSNKERRTFFEGRVVWPVFSGKWTPPRFVPVAPNILYFNIPASISREIASNLLTLAKACLANTVLEPLLDVMRGPLSYLANEEPMFYAFSDNTAQILLKTLSENAYVNANLQCLLVAKELRALVTLPLHTGMSFKHWLSGQVKDLQELESNRMSPTDIRDLAVDKVISDLVTEPMPLADRAGDQEIPFAELTRTASENSSAIAERAMRLKRQWSSVRRVGRSTLPALKKRMKLLALTIVNHRFGWTEFVLAQLSVSAIAIIFCMRFSHLIEYLSSSPIDLAPVASTGQPARRSAPEKVVESRSDQDALTQVDPLEKDDGVELRLEPSLTFSMPLSTEFIP